MLALLIIDRVGRKKLVYTGVSGMILSLVMIGLYFSWVRLGMSSLFLLGCFRPTSSSQPLHQRRHLRLPLRDVPHEDSGLAMSIAALLWIGTFDRAAHSWLLENQPPRNLLPVCLHVHTLHADCMEDDAETASKSLEEIERFWLKKK